MAKKKKKKKSNVVLNIMIALVFLAGAGVFLYPTTVSYTHLTLPTT